MGSAWEASAPRPQMTENELRWRSEIWAVLPEDSTGGQSSAHEQDHEEPRRGEKPENELRWRSEIWAELHEDHEEPRGDEKRRWPTPSVPGADPSGTEALDTKNRAGEGFFPERRAGACRRALPSSRSNTRRQMKSLEQR
jgi:hypothetical protein